MREREAIRPGWELEGGGRTQNGNWEKIQDIEPVFLSLCAVIIIVYVHYENASSLSLSPPPLVYFCFIYKYIYSTPPSPGVPRAEREYLISSPSPWHFIHTCILTPIPSSFPNPTFISLWIPFGPPTISNKLNPNPNHPAFFIYIRKEFVNYNLTYQFPSPPFSLLFKFPPPYDPLLMCIGALLNIFFTIKQKTYERGRRKKKKGNELVDCQGQPKKNKQV